MPDVVGTLASETLPTDMVIAFAAPLPTALSASNFFLF